MEMETVIAHPSSKIESLTATHAGWWMWTTHLASGRAAWMAECRTKPAMLTPKFVVPGSTTLP